MTFRVTLNAHVRLRRTYWPHIDLSLSFVSFFEEVLGSSDSRSTGFRTASCVIEPFREREVKIENRGAASLAVKNKPEMYRIGVSSLFAKANVAAFLK